MLSIANEVDPLIFWCICFVCNTNMYFSTKEIAIKEVPFRELTGIWNLEVFTLVLTLTFGKEGWVTSLPKDPISTAAKATSSNSSETESRLEVAETFLFLVPWLASVSPTPFSTYKFFPTLFLPFFSFPLLEGATDPICSITPFLMGMQGRSQ